MNAAARLVHQHTLSGHFVFRQSLSLKQMGLILLVMTILASALAIIYTTNVSRGLYASYQANLAIQNHLQIENSRLLLAISTETVQGRIQGIAEHDLNMEFPSHKQVVIIKE